MTGEPSDQLLEELARAKEVTAAAVARTLEVEAELANTRAENSDLLARNALLELQAEKMRRGAVRPTWQGRGVPASGRR